ncbi:hypothetical protein U9M48_031019 [Paspalum notatum var. saurae]|uniref:protein-serine/threonine phosphatase n=1 Tax=Paspalum notatum var. saurae TaxID=547442 RepID=A0AAQ3U1R0_PASNO
MVMASAGVNVPGGDGSQAAPPEWRVRRRRRLAPPRAATAGSAAERRVRRLRRAAAASPSEGALDEQQEQAGEEAAAAGEVAEVEELEEEGGGDELPLAGLQQLAAAAAARPAEAAAAQACWPVAFGSLSIAGRMRMMEDAVSLRPAFTAWVDGSPMHFFAVFDGHGGSHVSMLCRDRMHALLAEELAKEGAELLHRRRQHHQHHHQASSSSSSSSSATGGSGWSGEQEEEERAWRAALCEAFRRVDALAELACACGRVASPRCTCSLSAADSSSPPGIVGSTAVVALLVRGRLVVANCGDSRAVLCRGPAGAPPVPLSSDHKPNRPDELARIQAVGGRVLFNNGPRVRGILAMSRALGDRLLRPEVIPEPEITITDRTAEDECLILASDGMWDVIPNEIACNVARHCLQDGTTPAAAPAPAPAAVGNEAEPRCYRAASLLARLAIGRETPDNISIVVIDLKQRE